MFDGSVGISNTYRVVRALFSIRVAGKPISTPPALCLFRVGGSGFGVVDIFVRSVSQLLSYVFFP